MGEEVRVVSPAARTHFRKSILERVTEHARSSYAKDEEACGYLTGPAATSRFSATNRSRLPNLANRYHEMDPETYPRTGRTYFLIDPLEVRKGGRARARPTAARCGCSTTRTSTWAPTSARPTPPPRPWAATSLRTTASSISSPASAKAAVDDHKLFEWDPSTQDFRREPDGDRFSLVGSIAKDHQQMSHSGFVVWFTGLVGIGKIDPGRDARQPKSRGADCTSRHSTATRCACTCPKGLGFSKEDRDTNVRRIGFVAKLIARSGACAITAAISPYRDDPRRAATRRERAILRGVLLLSHRRALRRATRRASTRRRSRVRSSTSPASTIPTRRPTNADVVVHTDNETKEQSLAKILAKLEELGFIHRAVTASGTAAGATKKLIVPHGGELVDRWVHGAEKERLAEKAKSLACDRPSTSAPRPTSRTSRSARSRRSRAS